MPLLVEDGFTISEEALTLQEREAGLYPLKKLEWHAFIQGNVVEIYRTGCVFPERVKTRRGEVGPWSQQSRMNLLRFINRIDWKKIGPSVFVTLTYPDDIPHKDYVRRSADRYLFLRSLEAYIEQPVACLWRCEWKLRKSGQRAGELMPHFHLVPFGVGFLPHQMVREWWRDAIGREAGSLATDVRRITGEAGACKYLAKYVSKEASLDISTYHNSGIKFGRHWGVTRRERVPLCPASVDRVLTREEVEHVQAFASARWRWYDKDLNAGYTLLGGQEAAAFSRYFNRA